MSATSASETPTQDRIEIRDGRVRMVQLGWASDNGRGIETYWRTESGVRWRSQGNGEGSNAGPIHLGFDQLPDGLQTMFGLTDVTTETISGKFPGFTVGQLGG